MTERLRYMAMWSCIGGGIEEAVDKKLLDLIQDGRCSYSLHKTIKDRRQNLSSAGQLTGPETMELWEQGVF